MTLLLCCDRIYSIVQDTFWRAKKMTSEIENQIKLFSDSLAPMGGALDLNDRDLQKASELPFELIREIDPYNLTVDPRGRTPLPTRLAFAACYYQRDKVRSDSEMIESLKQNLYCQAFCGFQRIIMPDEVFAESDLRNLRKRYPDRLINMINEVMCGGSPAAAINDEVWVAEWKASGRRRRSSGTFRFGSVSLSCVTSTTTGWQSSRKQGRPLLRKGWPVSQSHLMTLPHRRTLSTSFSSAPFGV